MNLVLEISAIFWSWIVFYLFGWSEAFHWHYFAKSKTKLEQRYEHSLWTAIRFIVHIPIGLYLINQFGWFVLLGIAGLVTSSILIHDGSYYHWRNKLDGSYPLGWKSYGTTSTAKFTLDFQDRVSMFFYGVAAIGLMFLSKYDGI